MTWKNAILAGALAMGLSLSFVPSASADPWWKDNHHKHWKHQHHGDGWYRRHDDDWYRRRNDDWRAREARRRAEWQAWQRRHDDAWARRDRWERDHAYDRGWYSSGRDYGYRTYPRYWAWR